MFEGNPTLRGAGEKFEYTPDMIREIIKCKEDILYFAENYFYIQNLNKGKIKIPLWGFQKSLIKAIKEPPNGKKHICVLAARQMSKTTVTTIYILHQALFQKDYTIGILANREKTAINILGRIQMAFQLLPLWLQRGVVEYNKTTIKLENGVKLMSSSTSSNSIRGESLNEIFIDECAFIFDYIWDDFQASVMPTISSSEKGKIIMVSTPNGLNHFYNIYKAGVLGENDFYSVKLPWHLHPERDDKWKEGILRSGYSHQQFEQEYNCKFLGSSSQLIEADKLEELTPREPIDISHYSGALQIYEQPIEGEKYIIGVDPGKGSGNDYSVIQVLKIVSEYEIHQVAVFRSNYIKIDKLVDITIGISDFYNECEVMAESNDVGELFCDDLWNKKSFERLLNCDKKGLGIRATKKSKLEGNLLLKKYIENGWLAVCDKRTIYELSRYIEVSPNVFHAEGQNENDDCVSSLLWALYYLTTDFYDKTDTKASEDGEKNSFSNFAIMDGNVVGGGYDEYGFGADGFGNFNSFDSRFGML
jgi:hypothetical protein